MPAVTVKRPCWLSGESRRGSRRPARRTFVICLMVLSLLGVLMLSILGTRDVCPGLSSDQAVVSAAARYAACSKSTDAWSRGAR